jgi:hypothetical protein
MRAIYKTAQPIPRTGLPNEIPQAADLARFIGRPTNPYQITITPVCA